jgi:hypothetical protein
MVRPHQSLLHRVVVHDINSSRCGSVIYYELFLRKIEIMGDYGRSLNFSKFDQNLNLIPLPPPPPNVRKIAILAPPLPLDLYY